MRSSNGYIFRVAGPSVRGIHRSPVNSPHKCQWHRALMFSLICAWLNGWVNHREVGDLRRHRPHYDVTVMCCGHVTVSPAISAYYALVSEEIHWKQNIVNLATLSHRMLSLRQLMVPPVKTVFSNWRPFVSIKHTQHVKASWHGNSWYITGFCEEDPPVISGFPSQRTRNSVKRIWSQAIIANDTG